MTRLALAAPRVRPWTTLSALLVLLVALTAADVAAQDRGPFRRIAHFPVFLNTDVDDETVAEIVAASEDGRTLVYTDGQTENVGFVDITDPAQPAADGVVAVDGEPTSVAVAGSYVLAGVNTSESFVAPSGALQVIDLVTRTVVRTIDLGGQPDSIAVSPDRRYAVVVIENERDEDLGDGAPPQAPGGFAVIVDLVGEVADWTTRMIDLTGIATLFPADPEPEYVDINEINQAVISLQENNHLVIVDLASGMVIADFSAGTVDLIQVDDNENDLIEQTASLDDVPREPDAVAWTALDRIATADEGDLDGGSRGFTIFDTLGNTVFEAGNSVEHLMARIGHYPEDRSENKGNEPEAVEFGDFGDSHYLFVGSERSSVVVVYHLTDGAAPQLVQVLPASTAPEGLLALPQRDLLVVASEEDARDDKVRSTISIYQRFQGGSQYPRITSTNRENGTPIPWAALSGLALHPTDPDVAYTVHDSFYRRSRIYTLDLASEPARIVAELELSDRDDVLRNALTQLAGQLPGAEDFDPDDLIDVDGAVNLDPEGVAVREGGGFWLASEGSGNLMAGVSDPEDRPFRSPNLLLGIADNGTIDRVVLLPTALTANQLRFGFEGVTVGGDGAVYVAFQRAWQDAGDPADRVRIGRWADGAWSFAFYPLDDATSPNGGWVGLSDLTDLGDDTFAVIERDNQGGPDATVKRIYTFSTDGVAFAAEGAPGGFPALTKTLATDLIADGHLGTTGGPVLEKWEGLLALPDGSALIVNDNDGVDDSNGETQLLRINALFTEGGGSQPGDVEPFVCVNTDTTICLNGGRFEVSATWENFDGETDSAFVADFSTADSALLWFFRDDNLEVLLKVLDGCGSTDHYWVFSAATTNLGYRLRVVDSFTGRVRVYDNPVGNDATATTDTRAFATCP